MALRGMVFCPTKTEGCMIWLPFNDAWGTWFLLHQTAASELDPILKIPLGVSIRALSRASSVFLGARKHRREAPSSTSTPHQKYRRSSFARAPSRSQLATVAFAIFDCFSLTNWKLEVEAAPFFLRCLSQNSSKAADAPPHRCPWAHIERA